MQTSENGLELIKQFEGFSGVPYYCPAWKLTIGYGHVILSGENFPKAGILKIEATNLLKQDVSMAEKAINRLVKIPLLQNQFDALVSFAYNIGAQRFENSTLLRFLNDNRMELVAKEFSRWVFAGGIMQKGLVKRRKAEKKLFISSCDGSIK
ncbi:MAG: lysozyme [Pseudomonadota bacterium]